MSDLENELVNQMFSVEQEAMRDEHKKQYEDANNASPSYVDMFKKGHFPKEKDLFNSNSIDSYSDDDYEWVKLQTHEDIGTLSRSLLWKTNLPNATLLNLIFSEDDLEIKSDTIVGSLGKHIEHDEIIVERIPPHSKEYRFQDFSSDFDITGGVLYDYATKKPVETVKKKKSTVEESQDVKKEGVLKKLFRIFFCC